MNYEKESPIEILTILYNHHKFMKELKLKNVKTQKTEEEIQFHTNQENAFKEAIDLLNSK